MHWAAAQARAKALCEAPLVSRAKLLERQQGELLAKHPQTRIRFRFPDQCQLEATFGSEEGVADLYRFLEACCAHPRPAVSLSTGPPARVLPRSGAARALWQADLIPAAVVNVALEGAPTRDTLEILCPVIVAASSSDGDGGGGGGGGDVKSSTDSIPPTAAPATAKAPAWMRMSTGTRPPN